MASSPPPPPSADDLPDAPSDEPVDDADTVSGEPVSSAPAPAGAAWPDDDDPLAEGWEEDWAADPPSRSASAIDWSGLEVESFDALPAGRVLAGRTESFRVDGLGAEDVPAVLDTGRPRSHLRAKLEPGASGGVEATFAGRTVLLVPRREGDVAVVDVTVRIGSHKQAVALVLESDAASDPSRPLVLGVDALAGLVVVDPAAADLLSRR
jgi:hypothetical protein